MSLLFYNWQWKLSNGNREKGGERGDAVGGGVGVGRGKDKVEGGADGTKVGDGS